jgi:polyribonucleotide nucleotidyltransferase
VNVASSDAEGLAKAIQMISDITAVPEAGKTYLGKVVRLAEFGAFVEIFPGTDGLLHVSEIAEHRVKDVKDELREGDQILVKVIALEGNRIKLSRKAVLKEQRAKLGLPDPEQPSGDEPRRERAPRPERGQRTERSEPSEHPAQPKHEETVTIDGGDDFDDDDEDLDGDEDEAGDEGETATEQPVDGAPAGGARPEGQQRRGRRRRGRRPGGGGGGNAGAPPQGGNS